MSKAQLGAGNVEITLDGEIVTLRPSLKAAQQISRQTDGIRGALKGIGALDLDVITGIIAVGLGKFPKDIEGAVWRTGLPNLIDGVTEFVAIIANGGKRPNGGEEDQNPPASD